MPSLRRLALLIRCHRINGCRCGKSWFSVLELCWNVSMQCLEVLFQRAEKHILCFNYLVKTGKPSGWDYEVRQFVLRQYVRYQQWTSRIGMAGWNCQSCHQIASDPPCIDIVDDFPGYKPVFIGFRGPREMSMVHCHNNQRVLIPCLLFVKF